MLENTNTKQFYPGPILNNTLEITKFLFTDNTQIHVTYTTLNADNEPEDRELTYGEDYEVEKVLSSDINAAEAALTASTGLVKLKNLSVKAGEKITVYRETPLIQDMQYPRTGAFPAASHEGALDSIVMQNQEQQEQIKRSLKVPISVSNFDGGMPSPVPGKTLKINADATGFELSDLDVDEAFALTNQYKIEAQLSRDEALAQANIATAQANIAINQANNAEASANAAAETLTNAVAVITSEKTGAVEAITTQRESSVNAVKSQETISLNTIESQQTTSVNAVKLQETTSVNAVKSQQTTSVSSVKNEGTTQVNSVRSEGATQVNLAKAEVTKATTQANNAANSATAAANSATAAANSASQANTTLNSATTTINTEKTNAINAIKTQQTTSVNAVSTQQTNAIRAVQNQQTSSVNTVKSTGQSYVDKCKAWASSPNVVEGGLRSAKYYAEQAQGKSDVTYAHLRASRVYNDKGMLLTDEEGYADVAEMNRSTFDLSKFTIVGSLPLITDTGVFDGGVYTNNSAYNNYVQSVSFSFGGTSWSIKARIKPVLNPIDDKFQIIFCDQNSKEKQLSFFASYIGNRLGVIVRNDDDTGNIYGTDSFGAMVLNKEQDVELRYENKTLSTYVNGIQKATYSIDLDHRIFNNQKIVGMGIGSQAFYGNIYLPTLSVTSNGREVFNGNKTGLDVIKEDNFEVVGSPVISDDGVASGFKNGTNYLRTPIKTTDLLNKSWEIITNFIPSTCIIALTCWKLSNPNSQAGAEGLSSCGFNPNNNNLIFWFRTGDNSESSEQLYKSINVAKYLNERIYASYAYDSTTGIYTFKAYLENGTVISTLNYTATTTNKQLYYINTESNFIISVGTAYSGTLDVGGNIDLNAFKIYVDGQLVYQPCLKIPYNLSKNGAKVVPAYARDRVLDVYENHDKGYAYYTIDEVNKNFTLPLGTTFDNSLRRNLENITENGNKKLATSLMYETGNVSNDEKGYKQLTKMNRSTFDLSKFTVVGSPTITDDGIASGFSFGNCLNINVDLSNLDILKIKSTFKTPNADNRTNFSAVWQIKSTTSIGLEVVNQQMMIIDASGGKAAGQFTYENDTEYEVIWEYTISNGNWVLNYKKAIDTEFTTKTGTQVDYTVAKQSTLINIGTMNNYYYFTGGSIDLKQFSITVDGKEVFNGNKTGVDVIKPDNYTVVGSPTISEDGVVSGLDNTNYCSIKTGIITDSHKPFKIVSEFYFTYLSGVAQALWQLTGASGWHNYCYLGDNINVILILSDNTTPVLRINRRLTDGRYRLTLEWTGASYVLSLFDESGTHIETATLETNLPLNSITSNTIINIGRDSHSQYYWHDSIDLNAFKIYVDSQLVCQPCLKIPYNISKTGSKIVHAYARDRVIDLYEQEGHAGYYTIDEEKKNFTLPMGEIFGLIGQRSLRSVTRDGANYCEIYSDKTIEQGGTCTANVEVTFQQPFVDDTNYVLSVPYSSKTATSFIPTQTGDWIAKGKGV